MNASGFPYLFHKMYKRSLNFSSETKTDTGLCLPPWDLAAMCFFAVQVCTWPARGFCADGNQIPRASGTEGLGQITGRSVQQILHQQLRTPWSLGRHLLATSAETRRALTNNKRSALGGSLYLNYEKKEKNLCQVSTLHVVHPLSQSFLWSWNRLLT